MRVFDRFSIGLLTVCFAGCLCCAPALAQGQGDPGLLCPVGGNVLAQAESSPVSAVVDYFDALVDRDFAKWWDCLSLRTRKQMIDEICAETNVSPEAVEKMFAEPNGAFAQSIMDSMNDEPVERVSADTMEVVKQDGNVSTIREKGTNDYLKCVYEQGVWRLDLDL